MAEQKSRLGLLDPVVDAYNNYIGRPFASFASGAVNGYLGRERPGFASEEAYRTAQALSNMPGFGAPAGIFKAAANAPDALVAIGGLLGKAAVPKMSAQEARAAGYWHPIGLGKKLEKPYQDISFATETIKNLPARKNISLEDLQGQYIVPAVGDRTAAGKLLTEVEGVKFNNPVELEGGPDFMLTHGARGGPDSTIWASGQSIVSALRNRAVQAESMGGNANLMYVPMGYNSLNFSTMPTDAALEMIKSGKITKKAKKEFDNSVRAFRPEFAGIDSPQAIEQLRANGELRHAFLDRMQLDQFRNAGFPDITAIRKSIMEPALENVPLYHGGYSVGKIDTSFPINKLPKLPHKTYPAQLHGTVIGGMDIPVPHTMLWQDFFNERRARGMPVEGDRMAFERSKPLQLVNQGLLDQVMPYVEAARRSGRP
jgi:hypothetical protein